MALMHKINQLKKLSSAESFLGLRPLYAVAHPSVVCLSVVCNARAPYSARWNFPQFFYGLWYFGHLL